MKTDVKSFLTCQTVTQNSFKHLILQKNMWNWVWDSLLGEQQLHVIYQKGCVLCLGVTLELTPKSLGPGPRHLKVLLIRWEGSGCDSGTDSQVTWAWAHLGLGPLGPLRPRPTWAWAHLGPGLTWARAHLDPGPLGPGCRKE